MFKQQVLKLLHLAIGKNFTVKHMYVLLEVYPFFCHSFSAAKQSKTQNSWTALQDLWPMQNNA